MSKFCGKCGAPLHAGAAFCGSCGASTQEAASPASQPEFQPVASPAPSSPAPLPAVASSTAVAKSSSPWLKIVIVVVIVIFAVGALAVGGVIYVAHKVSQKAQEYKREVLGDSPTPAPGAATSDAPGAGGAQPAAPGDGVPAPQAGAASSGVPSGFSGNACRLLSKEDVSRAIGMDVVETTTTDGGCSYFAKGKSVDMTAKHAAAMVGKIGGADKKTQGMFEQFAGAVGGSMPKNERSENDRPDGTTAVLVFAIDTNDAEEQMKLNAKVLGIGGMGGIDAIDGIGDEAFSKADSMMFVRKGDKLIRIMYMTCPCSTDAIKPLAKTIVANL